jgi:transcriptional regulator with XRE-family HTH domain
MEPARQAEFRAILAPAEGVYLMGRVIEGPDEEAWMKAVGDRLRLLRESVGLTQLQMAKMIGYKTKQVWTKYEGGKLTPKPYHMVIVAARLRVSLDYVYRGTLFGVHPGIGQELVARKPELIQATRHILRDMGIDQASGTAPTWWLPLQ